MPEESDMAKATHQDSLLTTSQGDQMRRMVENENSDQLLRVIRYGGWDLS